MESRWIKGPIPRYIRPSMCIRALSAVLINSGRMWEVKMDDGGVRHYWNTDYTRRNISRYRVPVKLKG